MRRLDFADGFESSVAPTESSTDVSALEARVDTLEATDISHDSRLDALETDVLAAETNIIDHQNRLDIAEADIVALEDDVMQLQADVTDVTAGDINSEAATGGYVLTSDGTGGASWQATSSSGVLSVSTKSSAYTLTASDDVILADSSGGAFTLTLPIAASNTGKVFKIKKTTGDFSPVTIDAEGAETIDGDVTTTINTQGETLSLVSDGANWQITERRIPDIWTAFTIAIAGTISNPTKGTVIRDNAWWRRTGETITIRYEYEQSAGGAAGSGDYLFSIPSGLTMNNSKITVSGNSNQVNCLGSAVVSTTASGLGNTTRKATINAITDTQFVIVDDQTTVQGFVRSDSFSLSAQVLYAAEFSVPISGWKG